MFKTLERIALALERIADLLARLAGEPAARKPGKPVWTYSGKPRVFMVDEEREWLNQQPEAVRNQFRKVEPS